MTLITDDMKTEWFPAGIKPVHVGSYEVMRPGMEGNGIPALHTLKWDGKNWRYLYSLGWCDYGDFASVTGSERWRGLKVPHDGETS